MQITVLGCRGSMPVAQKEMLEFGGDTACYQIEEQGESLFLDAGSGLFHRDRKVILYGTAAGGLSLEEQVTRLVEPPLWPAALYQYPADVQFQEVCSPHSIGPFMIEAMPSCHPGGSLVFRISVCGKSVVYATDFEHTQEKTRELTAFSAGADLLLYDAQYTEEEYAVKKGFGHSTAEAGKRIKQESGAEQLLLIHHDPRHTDGFLKEQEKTLGVHFARQGEVICI